MLMAAGEEARRYMTTIIQRRSANGYKAESASVRLQAAIRQDSS